MPEPFEIATFDLPADSEIHALIAACPGITGVRFTNDEFVVHGTDTAQDVYILLRGNCLVEQPDAPRERTPGNELAIISAEPDAPVFVGEMAYLGGGFRSASVRSVLNCFTLRLAPEHLDTIIDRLPGLTRILCRQFARRLSEANVFIKNFQRLSAMDVSQRMMAPGETLVEAGAPADTLFQLIDGLLVEEGPTPRRIKPAGDAPVFVGVRPFFAAGRHPHTIVARTPAIVLGLGRSRIDAVIRNFPELALQIIQERLGDSAAAPPARE